ncbi:hypothetical protein LWI28_015574 [Acer negundo]|uniref:Uncharacterized protein n=1 Tax=Acer negundo TaxID=4023 RepID=A0AAD5P3A3_ACENE|nr:hypothetical protein LWI28_015574 [Acer negundo]
MEEAWQFTTKHRKNLENLDSESNLAMEVKHAIELPLHWRDSRLEARWWESYDLEKKLSFARRRLVASFLWGMGVVFEPRFKYCRGIVTKLIAVITVIDDVYGTLPELELFTDAVDRWDIKTMNQLPDYMKICLLAIFNFVNEMTYEILKEKDFDVGMNLKNSWVRLLQAYMVEVKWFHSGQKPTLEEYMKNARTTIAGPIVAVHSYLAAANPVIEKELECLETNPADVIYWSFKEETYTRHAENLKEKMRDIMINNASKPLDQLELIDTLQRLGLAYHFNTEIKNTLPNVYNDSTTDDMGKKGNLHDTSLEIRLLRQHVLRS